LTTLFASGMIG